MQGNKGMWVPKTAEELKTAKQRSHKKYKRTISLSVLGIVAAITFFRGGIEAATKGSYFVPLDEIPGRFVNTLIVLLSIVLLSLIFGTRRSNPDDEEGELALVCPKCERVKAWDGYLPCECGGHFEDIRTMKWVEGSKES